MGKEGIFARSCLNGVFSGGNWYALPLHQFLARLDTPPAPSPNNKSEILQIRRSSLPLNPTDHPPSSQDILLFCVFISSSKDTSISSHEKPIKFWIYVKPHQNPSPPFYSNLQRIEFKSRQVRFLYSFIFNNKINIQNSTQTWHCWYSGNFLLKFDFMRWSAI